MKWGGLCRHSSPHHTGDNGRQRRRSSSPAKAFSLPSGSSSITPTSKTPWCSRHTTSSATAALSLTPVIPTSRSHSWLSAGPLPSVETAPPTKPAVAKKPATQIWPGQLCTPYLTNRCRAKPPIPVTSWRFFNDREYRTGCNST